MYNALNPTRYELIVTNNGSPYFILLNEDEESLGKSEIFKSSTTMIKGIRAVMENSADSSVEEEAFGKEGSHY